MRTILLLITLFFSFSTLTAQDYIFKSRLASPGSGDEQVNGPVGIAIASNGDILIGDLFNNRVKRFDKNGVYQGHFGSPGSGDGQFSLPAGVAIAPNGDILVADLFNHRVQRFNSDGVYQSKFGSFGSGDGQFNQPVSLAVAPNGDILVSEQAGDRVQRFSSEGVYLSQFGNGSGSGDGQFNNPYDIAFASNGDILIADWNNRVQRFNSDGVYLSQFGGLGSGDGQLSLPFGILIDPIGNILVSEWGNDRVQIFDSNGVYKNKFGSLGSGDGQLSDPSSMVLAANGDLFVTNYNGDNVQVFERAICKNAIEFDIESASLDTEKSVDGTNVYVVEVCFDAPSYNLEFETSPADIFATVEEYPGNTVNCRKLRVTYGDGAEWVVRVINTNDCTGEISYLDVANEEMTIMDFTSTNESKAGLSDGTARVEVEGGNDPYGVYTYEWTGPLTSITVTDGSDGNEQTGLPAGIYTVVVTDAANNSQTISGVVKRNNWGGRGRGRMGKTALEPGSGELFLAATPNPFEDFTTIQFQTSTVENVSIEVLGMNGQQVAHLFEGQSTGASLQNVTFNRGSLQAGTYLIRLVSESGAVQHQKVVVY